jgi:predicted TIM-barrel fold metal-dependent hydrolase
VICDSHVHFFSPTFFSTLAAERHVATVDALRHLGWDDPVSPKALADRWDVELETQGVSRAAIIASVPGDEASVAGAVEHHPSRFVGYFMLDPTKEDAENRVVAALELGLRGVCLFPAMQGYSLHDPRVARIAEIAAGFGPPADDAPFSAGGVHRGPVLFVHCGVLSVGARRKLGLASPFDMRHGNPLDLHALALRHPRLPIVIPHFGAGLLREALMVADQCSNIYFDTSSSNSWVKYQPDLTLEKVFESALAVIGPERILFGTDSSFFPRGWHRAIYNQQRAALIDLGVSDAQQAAIFGGNFERLFGRA